MALEAVFLYASSPITILALLDYSVIPPPKEHLGIVHTLHFLHFTAIIGSVWMSQYEPREAFLLFF